MASVPNVTNASIVVPQCLYFFLTPFYSMVLIAHSLLLFGASLHTHASVYVILLHWSSWCSYARSHFQIPTNPQAVCAACGGGTLHTAPSFGVKSLCEGGGRHPTRHCVARSITERVIAFLVIQFFMVLMARLPYASLAYLLSTSSYCARHQQPTLEPVHHFTISFHIFGP